MITDPVFYAVAVPAVTLTGLSKGGFGGAFGFAAVPLIALVVPPVQAAALMLPILLVMDAIAVASYRRLFDRRVILTLLPFGVAGIVLGWATAEIVPDSAVRLLVGGIALAFLARVYLGQRRDRRASLGAAAAGAAERRSGGRGAWIWGTIAGYTSFVAHAGGPPFQTYVVPMRLDPVIYAGTSAIFFAMINAIKVIPYAALGELDTTNLTTAAVLFPVAALSTFAGVKLVRGIDPRNFYRVLVVSIAAIGAKLIYDGVTGLLGF